MKDGETPADQLVVHQQDIQAVVNALWSGGAEAMTLQKQRVVSTTGIKCVGNTVVLHGVPYAPPYVITAVGDVGAMKDALDSSDYIAGYLTYVRAYDLGYRVTSSADTTAAGVPDPGDACGTPRLPRLGGRQGRRGCRRGRRGRRCGRRLGVGGDHDRDRAALVQRLT